MSRNWMTSVWLPSEKKLPESEEQFLKSSGHEMIAAGSPSEIDNKENKEITKNSTLPQNRMSNMSSTMDCDVPHNTDSVFEGMGDSSMPELKRFDVEGSFSKYSDQITSEFNTEMPLLKQEMDDAVTIKKPYPNASANDKKTNKRHFLKCQSNKNEGFNFRSEKKFWEQKSKCGNPLPLLKKDPKMVKKVMSTGNINVAKLQSRIECSSSMSSRSLYNLRSRKASLISSKCNTKEKSSVRKNVILPKSELHTKPLLPLDNISVKVSKNTILPDDIKSVKRRCNNIVIQNEKPNTQVSAPKRSYLKRNDLKTSKCSRKKYKRSGKKSSKKTGNLVDQLSASSLSLLKKCKNCFISLLKLDLTRELKPDSSNETNQNLTSLHKPVESSHVLCGSSTITQLSDKIIEINMPREVASLNENSANVENRENEVVAVQVEVVGSGQNNLQTTSYVEYENVREKTPSALLIENATNRESELKISSTVSYSCDRICASLSNDSDIPPIIKDLHVETSSSTIKDDYDIADLLRVPEFPFHFENLDDYGFNTYVDTEDTFLYEGQTDLKVTNVEADNFGKNVRQDINSLTNTTGLSNEHRNPLRKPYKGSQRELWQQCNIENNNGEALSSINDNSFNTISSASSVKNAADKEKVSQITHSDLSCLNYNKLHYSRSYNSGIEYENVDLNDHVSSSTVKNNITETSDYPFCFGVAIGLEDSMNVADEKSVLHMYTERTPSHGQTKDDNKPEVFFGMPDGYRFELRQKYAEQNEDEALSFKNGNPSNAVSSWEQDTFQSSALNSDLKVCTPSKNSEKPCLDSNGEPFIIDSPQDKSEMDFNVQKLLQTADGFSLLDYRNVESCDMPTIKSSEIPPLESSDITTTSIQGIPTMDINTTSRRYFLMQPKDELLCSYPVSHEVWKPNVKMHLQENKVTFDNKSKKKIKEEYLQYAEYPDLFHEVMETYDSDNEMDQSIFSRRPVPVAVSSSDISSTETTNVIKPVISTVNDAIESPENRLDFFEPHLDPFKFEPNASSPVLPIYEADTEPNTRNINMNSFRIANNDSSA